VRFDADARIGEGRLLPIDLTMAPLAGEDGRIDRLVASGIDLSERREIETRSRNRLAQLEAIYSTAPVGLCVIDPAGRFVRINERLAEINGVPVEAHLGRTVSEVVPDLAAQAVPLLQRVQATGQPVDNLEIEGETPAQPGRKRTWRENWTPIVDSASGAVLGVNVVAEEITEWKLALERLRESEARALALAEQRELLLHEVNHRVKNSLALVASMLALQRRRVSGEAAAALADAHRRILAIGRVHESLYTGTTGDRIDLVSLSEGLLGRTGELRPDVAIRFAADGPASLPTDRAVPYGLLLNELAVNAVKHAFGDGERGEVAVSLAQGEDGAIRLTVADDGVGLPEDWSLETGSGLGSRLILGLAHQLDATVVARSGPGRGARFEVAIPDDTQGT
jgi:PAS domain S-box-containing protein